MQWGLGESSGSQTQRLWIWLSTTQSPFLPGHLVAGHWASMSYHVMLNEPTRLCHFFKKNQHGLLHLGNIIKPNVECKDKQHKPHNPSLIMRKTSEKSQLVHILQNTWPGLLKTVKAIKKKKRKVWDNVTTKKSKMTWQLSLMWYPGLDSETEKGHSVKIKEFWIKCGL